METSYLEVVQPFPLMWTDTASFLFDLYAEAMVSVSWLIEDDVRDTFTIPRTLDLLGFTDAHAGPAHSSAKQDVGM